MTADDEIRDHQARCQPHLLTLQMLARGEGGSALAAAEVGQVTGAIIAEAAAASRAALVASGENHRRPGAGTFLQARLNRLAAAAAAARDGNSVRLGRLLRRFEALTLAIWMVQHAVCGPPASARLPSEGSAVGQPPAGIR